MTYDYGVFIGRFQPFHKGHAKVVNVALENVNKLIILIGSANNPRTIRNPFTFDERKEFITSLYQKEINEGRIILKPLNDMTYQDTQWVRQVQDIVDMTIIEDHPSFRDYGFKIALVGSQKDNSGFYLSLFPQWQSIPVIHKNPVNSTDIRKVMYSAGDKFYRFNKMPEHVELPVAQRMWTITENSWFTTLVEEYQWCEDYKSKYDNAPYRPTFVTVDAVVIQSGNVLLVKRNAMPGKGKWALPGGYIEQFETIDEAILRELREETKIDVSDTRLLACRGKKVIFDDPHRSPRGRVITTARLFKLPDEATLPKVKGSDDAAEAFWVPLSQLTPEKLFEDHAFIIQVMTSDI
jgi:bifunctional NMN adenylyltransferase/nudix hydrolase